MIYISWWLKKKTRRIINKVNKFSHFFSFLVRVIRCKMTLKNGVENLIYGCKIESLIYVERLCLNKNSETTFA